MAILHPQGPSRCPLAFYATALPRCHGGTAEGSEGHGRGDRAALRGGLLGQGPGGEGGENQGGAACAPGDMADVAGGPGEGEFFGWKAPEKMMEHIEI